MKQHRLLAPIVLLLALTAVPGRAQTSGADRTTTRDQLGALLTRYGSRKDVGIDFQRARSNEWNFSGTRTGGLTFADSLEVVAHVSDKQTLSFSIYPHYRGNYISVDRARDSAGLMRRLLSLTRQTFFYWGVDGDGDVFFGFTFTLESGFPSESILMVLRSIENMDEYVGELGPCIDGSSPPFIEGSSQK